MMETADAGPVPGLVYTAGKRSRTKKKRTWLIPVTRSHNLCLITASSKKKFPQTEIEDSFFDTVWKCAKMACFPVDMLTRVMLAVFKGSGRRRRTEIHYGVRFLFFFSLEV